MPKRLTRRVLLIGWDAADWNIIHPLMEAGKMPIFKKFVETGTSGKIATLQPIISPILWTSIATGKSADKHDILGFVEPSPDGEGIRPVTSTSRKCKAIWNILSQSGLRSTVINWFASHPAEPIAGNILTNRLTNMVGKDGKRLPLPSAAVHPPEILELAESFRVYPKEITIKQMLAFFPEAIPADKTDPRLGMLAGLLSQCATTQNAATYFAAEEDWDLLAVYYDAIDHAGHVFMEYHPPAMAHVVRRTPKLSVASSLECIASTICCSAACSTWSDRRRRLSSYPITAFITIICVPKCGSILAIPPRSSATK